jgi:hypothetical protein
MTKLEPMLADVRERLAGVVIEQLPYGNLIERCVRDGTLFYLDPPYIGGETDYGTGVFERADYGGWPTSSAASPVASFCRSTTCRSRRGFWPVRTRRGGPLIWSRPPTAAASRRVS